MQKLRENTSRFKKKLEISDFLLLVRNRNELEYHQDYEERGQDAERERVLIQDGES